MNRLPRDLMPDLILETQALVALKLVDLARAMGAKLKLSDEQVHEAIRLADDFWSVKEEVGKSALEKAAK